MIRDNAVGKQTSLAESQASRGLSVLPRNLSAQLNLLMSAAQDPNPPDQERASIEDKIDHPTKS